MLTLNANDFVRSAVATSDELDERRTQQTGELHTGRRSIFRVIKIRLVESDGKHFSLVSIPGNPWLVIGSFLKNKASPCNSCILFVHLHYPGTTAKLRLWRNLFALTRHNVMGSAHRF